MPDSNREDRAADRGHPLAGGHGRVRTTPNEIERAFADRHAGQEANLAAATAAHRDDRERPPHALAALARSGHVFNSNDVEALVLTDGGGDLNNRNVISSLMGGWAYARKIVEVTDRPPARSLRRCRHGSRVAWWRGTSAEEAA